MPLKHITAFEINKFFTSGLPCPEFDCILLKELADSCKNLAKNENYQFCYEVNRNVMFKCLNNCQVFECNAACYEKFDKDIKKCPCAPECPGE